MLMPTVDVPFAGTLQEFAETWGTGSRSDFRAAHRAPFLLRLSVLPDVPSALTEEINSLGTLSLPPCDLAAPLAFGVIEVRKRAKHALNDMVTVGRAANNDVVFPSGDVSKFHAFFRETPRGWVLVDAQSTNGTFLDGRAIVPARVEPLELDRSPVSIRFGNVACELVSPQVLWDRVRLYFSERRLGVA
jgi:hypothetical protein